MTILLVEQNARWRSTSPTTPTCSENGRIVLDGTPDAPAQRTRTSASSTSASAATAQRSYRDVKQYRRSRRWYG